MLFDSKIPVPKFRIGADQLVGTEFSSDIQQKFAIQIPTQLQGTIFQNPAFITIGKQCFAAITQIIYIQTPFGAETIERKRIDKNRIQGDQSGITYLTGEWIKFHGPIT